MMKTNKYIYRVDRYEINYIRIILESYDGMAVLKTIDPKLGLIEVLTSPGCDNMIMELIEDLRKNEGMEISSIDYRGKS